MIHIKTENISILPYLDYVSLIFNSIYKIDSDIIVNYGTDNTGDVNIAPSTAIDFLSGIDPIPEKYSFYDWLGKSIPFLFQDAIEGPLIRVDELQNKVWIGADILLSSFYFLSCWQENFSDQNYLDRFPVKESLLYKLNVLNIPVVNYYFDVLATAIRKLKDKKISYRNHFSTIVTHDIDKCKSGWKENIYQLLKAGKIFAAIKVFWGKIFFNDIWFNFDEILKVENNYKISSTFFFIANSKKFNGHPNADYNLKDTKIQKVLNKIENAGSEIGIHGSIGSGWNEGILNNEIKLLNRKILGNRFHYLSFNMPKSFEILDSTGLKYDSSLGFSETTGFRSGVCFPYHPFNFKTNKPFSFLEFPLIIMDTSLINKKYMGLSCADAIKSIKKTINEVQKFEGVLVLLWHNTMFSGYKYQAWKNLFENVIDELVKRKSPFYNFRSFINESYKYTK